MWNVVKTELITDVAFLLLLFLFIFSTPLFAFDLIWCEWYVLLCFCFSLFVLFFKRRLDLVFAIVFLLLVSRILGGFIIVFVVRGPFHTDLRWRHWFPVPRPRSFASLVVSLYGRLTITQSFLYWYIYVFFSLLHLYFSINFCNLIRLFFRPASNVGAVNHVYSGSLV